jgi:dihydrofolate reductase
MRRIIAGLFMSLDGVVEAPEAWTGPYFNDEVGHEIGSMMAQGDTLLMGRKSYETFAASFSGQSGGMADAMNHTPKFVVSTTLEQTNWQNSTLIKSDVADEIGKLKQQPGKNINISGSATLIRSLLRDGLLDELRLQLFPLVLGSGARLFEGNDDVNLVLTDSTKFSTGVVNLVYRPADA